MRSSSLLWLVALLLAWAGAASVVVFPHGEALALALAPAWLGFAVCRLSRRARRLATAFLLALLLPLQGFAGAVAEARGPAHYHSGASAHSHRHVEHHFHSPEVGAIAVDHEQSAASAQVKRLDAAIRQQTPLVQRAAIGVELSSSSEPFIHFPIPEDRPPRV